eukprot:scaffold57729_cov19-Tisochrysis_lutea.AAC.1
MTQQQCMLLSLYSSMPEKPPSHRAHCCKEGAALPCHRPMVFSLKPVCSKIEWVFARTYNEEDGTSVRPCWMVDHYTCALSVFPPSGATNPDTCAQVLATQRAAASIARPRLHGQGEQGCRQSRAGSGEPPLC